MTDLQQEQYVEMAYARVSTKKQSLERQKTSIFGAVPDLKAMYYFEDTKECRARRSSDGTCKSMPRASRNTALTAQSELCSAATMPLGILL